MKKFIYSGKHLFLLTAALFLISCSGSSGNAGFEDAGWLVEHIDSDWWSSGDRPEAVLNFGFYFDDPSLKASDLESVSLTSPGGKYWEFTGSTLDTYFDEDPAYFGFYLRCYSSDWNYGKYVELGDYTIEVRLRNGSTSSKILNVPAPGSLTANPYSFAYSAAYAGSVSGGTDLPAKASISSASYDGLYLTVKFLVNDNKIYNGWIWLYDADDNYIGGGSRTYFLDTLSSFDTEGGTNTVVFTDSDNILEPGSTLDQVETVYVVLTDGKQYSAENYRYDCRSISAGKQIVPILTGVSSAGRNQPDSFIPRYSGVITDTEAPGSRPAAAASR